MLYIRTQQWFEVRTHDLSGRLIAAYHNLTFPLSWVQKVSYRSKRQSGRAVYRHLALLFLLYCIPLSLLGLFVRLRCRSFCSCSACMLKKKTPPKPYVLPPLRSSRGSRGHLFHESERTRLIPRLVCHSKPFCCSDRWGFEYVFKHFFFFWGGYTQDAESPEVLVCVCRVWLPRSASSPRELRTSCLKFGSWFGRNFSCYIFEQRGSFVFVLYFFFVSLFLCCSRSITRATALLIPWRGLLCRLILEPLRKFSRTSRAGERGC